MTSQKMPFYIYIVIIFLPFLLFYWMIPFVVHLTIGGDYLSSMVKMQMELLFSIRTGSFPLYVPGFAGGHSSSALTLGQIFHPLAYLASIMPGYWNGKAVEWNNFFKLLSLGFTHLALFGFLRKIRLSLFFSFLLSLITIYNLRLPDLYRYGAALEAYTAFLMLCAAIGWYFIKPTKWLGPLCMIGTTYMLICSGHPQMMYFGMLGAGLFLLVIPFFLSSMLPDKKADSKIVAVYWFKVGVFVCLGILISSLYILPFYFEFIKLNINRVGQSYAWANTDLETFFGTLNNFFLPLHSFTQSAFGGSSLILMVLVLPLLRAFKVKIPWSVWSIWVLLLFMFLFMQGSRTPLHRLTWEYFPFASSIRVAGRISLIMPFFIMLLLAWVIRAEHVPLRLRQATVTLPPAAILASISMGLMVIYYLLYIAGYGLLSSEEFHEYYTFPIGEFLGIHYFWIVSVIFVLGIISLAVFSLYCLRNRMKSVFGIVLILTIFVQLGITLKYRSAQWIESKYASPPFEEMLEQKKIMLDYLYYPGGGMHSSSVINQINRSFIEPFLGKIFTQIVPVESIDESYEKMRVERLPQQVFVEGYDIAKAKRMTENANNMKDGIVRLEYSSFNRLKFYVTSEAPAMFGLSYPYSGNWLAWVNGEKVHIYRANGEAHAVEIPAGASTIEFRYWSSAAFWGMIISAAVFAIIGLFACYGAFVGIPRIIGMCFFMFISIGGFTVWHNSLYRGDNLKTEYTWHYTPPIKTLNLAYGKNSWLSESANPMPYSHTRKEAKISKLVDGDKSPDSGFTTRLCDNPTWFLDLHNRQNIKIILLYASSQNTLVNTRQLDIAISDDGNRWITVASVMMPKRQNNPTNIVLERPQTARYISITASGKSQLSLDEVEVYGP